MGKLKSLAKRYAPGKAVSFYRLLKLLRNQNYRRAILDPVNIEKLAQGVSLAQPVQTDPLPEIYTQRLRLPPTAVAELCTQTIPSSSCPDPYQPNIMYGLGSLLKSYAGLPSQYPLKLQYSDELRTIKPPEARADFPMILVAGERARKLHMRFSNKIVHAIGHGIFYAPNFYTEEERIKEKKRLGKNALIFPIHSTWLVKTKHNTDFVLEMADRLSHEFDTVRFCLYWADYLLGHYNELMKSGYECVSAGDFHDPSFFARLKGLISTADVTFSNGYGGTAFVSTGLGVPHCIDLEEIDYDVSPDGCLENHDHWQKVNRKCTSLTRLFPFHARSISPRQASICDYFLGYSKVRSREAIRSLIVEAERLWQEGGYAQRRQNG